MADDRKTKPPEVSKEPEAKPVPGPPESNVRTADDLLGWLAAEYSPWVRTPACQDAVRILKPQTAEDVLKMLAEQSARNTDLQGTYHKAMRWFHGAGWSPVTGANPADVAEENKALRKRVAHLEDEVRSLNAHLMAANRQLRLHEEGVRARRHELLTYGEDRAELKPGITAGAR